jgi:hypothetical protein
LRIALWALLLAVAWTVALAVIAQSPGLRSTPGIWLGVFGLPGVVIANWVQSFLFHRFNNFSRVPPHVPGELDFLLQRDSGPRIGEEQTFEVMSYRIAPDCVE